MKHGLVPGCGQRPCGAPPTALAPAHADKPPLLSLPPCDVVEGGQRYLPPWSKRTHRELRAALEGESLVGSIAVWQEESSGTIGHVREAKEPVAWSLDLAGRAAQIFLANIRLAALRRSGLRSRGQRLQPGCFLHQTYLLSSRADTGPFQHPLPCF